uniref:Ig-like domain-containing protein n=1 Tax=Zonotrichia albicollis TaxID=44394 RepID=A0A8D2M5X4_ZONAL
LITSRAPKLLVEPLWRPAVPWDQVTLTCQGSGNTGVTTWYQDGQRWGQEKHNHLTVTEKSNYMCERPGTGLRPPVRVLDGEGGLGVPILAPALTPGASQCWQTLFVDLGIPGVLHVSQYGGRGGIGTRQV